MIFKTMRFQGWGIPFSFLFFMGFFPFAFVIAFHGMMWWVVVLGLIAAFVWSWAISKGLYRVRTIYFWVFLLGLTVDLIVALQEKDLVQMIVGILAVGSFLYLFSRLEKEIARADQNPHVNWFEGLPQFFPRVQIEVLWGDEWRKASLRKIDHQGMFIFLQKSEAESQEFKVNRAMKKARFSLRLRYRELHFEGEAQLQAVFYDRWLGMGLQICPKDLYHFTQYSKIVQNLKGEGYAT